MYKTILPTMVGIFTHINWLYSRRSFWTINYVWRWVVPINHKQLEVGGGENLFLKILRWFKNMLMILYIWDGVILTKFHDIQENTLRADFFWFCFFCLTCITFLSFGGETFCLIKIGVKFESINYRDSYRSNMTWDKPTESTLLTLVLERRKGICAGWMWTTTSINIKNLCAFVPQPSPNHSGWKTPSKTRGRRLRK